MKKLLLNYKLTLSMAFLAIVAVACGLKFTSIEVNDKTPMQGAEVTVTAKLVNANPDDERENNKNARYLLFAVRVPEDWSGVSVKATPDEDNGVSFNMSVCDGYAAYCQFCFPLEGYKWIGFQTDGMVSQGESAKAVAKLKVGNAMGEYDLDFATGAWSKDPAELLLENGDINLNLAFGNNDNFSDYSENNGNFNTSEYLLNAMTITTEEYNKRRGEMPKEYKATVTPSGKAAKEQPVWPDVANLTPITTAVTVIADPSGIEEVENDLSGNVEYYNLQGIRVENPENGLFIRCQGGKTTKVYVK